MTLAEGTPLTPVLSSYWDEPESWTLETYRRHDGYVGMRRALSMTPDEVIELVKDSGLRGRGGAGFSTGTKWSFVPQGNDGAGAKPHYLLVNADESEPGTCKDMPLLMATPHVLIEGMIVCCYAIRARHAFIYVRGEVLPVVRRLQAAVAEAYAAGLLGTDIGGTGFDLDITVHAGAGAYICGEETALIESLEGYRGQPRLRPPFPAVAGLYARPTVINNVETLANVPLIIQHGAAWFRQVGTEKSPGVKIFSLSGCVKNPGNYELPLGTTFRHLIYELGGGISGGRRIKAIMAAGASSNLIIADDKALDCPMDYESVQNTLGAPLGSASVIILDESVNMSWLANKTTHFFRHESCGKCTPCREGTYWMNHIAHRLETDHASKDDIDLFEAVATQMQGKCLCALGEFSTMAVVSSIRQFRPDFEARVRS